MNKYTFVFEFKGGTYISQFKANSLKKAISKWVHEVEIPKLTVKIRDKLIKETKMSDVKPILLTGLQNVWCMVLEVRGHIYLLNIIKTV